MTREIERPLDIAESAAEGTASESIYRKLVWAFGYSATVFLGWVALFGPRNIVGGKRFFGSFAGISAGDHVQMTYYLWLWWHQLTHGHSPWTDAFQFAATGHITRQPFGWPLVLVSMPVQAIFGPVGAFNATFYMTFVAAAGATFLWVRSLGLPRYAAAIAGFSFAYAPFRLAQRGHINSYVSFLLPLALYGAERALRGDKKGSKFAAWICAASFISLCASGEMHVVVYFGPLFAVYVLVRGWRVPRDRLFSLAIPAVVLAVLSIFFLGLTYKTVYAPSARSAEAAPDVPPHYAARPLDLVRRSNPTERTAYPGAVTFALAALGVVAGLKRKNMKMIVATLLVAIAVAYFLAMIPAWGDGGNNLYNALKIVHRIRVPGRGLIISSLAFACLAAIGASRIRLRGRGPAIFAVVMVGFLLWDVSAFTRNVSAVAAEPNLSPTIPRGATVLDLPPFNPGHSLASRYSWQIVKNPGAHVGGYSVFVTPSARDADLSTIPLADVPPDPCRWKIVSGSVPFDYVVVDKSLFGFTIPKWSHSDGGLLVAALDQMPGFTRVSQVRDVVTYKFDRNALACPR